jgi:hypothetical protein
MQEYGLRYISPKEAAQVASKHIPAVKATLATQKTNITSKEDTK